jgi:hypothetical protein
MAFDPAPQVVGQNEGFATTLARGKRAFANRLINGCAARAGNGARFGNTVGKGRVVHSVFAIMPVNSGKQVRAIADHGDDKIRLFRFLAGFLGRLFWKLWLPF